MLVNVSLLSLFASLPIRRKRDRRDREFDEEPRSLVNRLEDKLTRKIDEAIGTLEKNILDDDGENNRRMDERH